MITPRGGNVQLGNDAGRDNFWRRERVAPNPQDPPTPSPKQLVCKTVARAVAGDFAPPILTVSLRHSAVPAAAMPETAVNKNGEALPAENEVGMAGD
jgi:hypothetical protein